MEICSWNIFNKPQSLSSIINSFLDRMFIHPISLWKHKYLYLQERAAIETEMKRGAFRGKEDNVKLGNSVPIFCSNTSRGGNMLQEPLEVCSASEEPEAFRGDQRDFQDQLSFVQGLKGEQDFYN